MKPLAKTRFWLIVTVLLVGGLYALYQWGFDAGYPTQKRLWTVGLEPPVIVAWAFLYFQIRYPKASQRRARYVRLFGEWAGRLMDRKEKGKARRQAKSEARLQRLYDRLATAEARSIVAAEANRVRLERAFPPKQGH